VPPTQNSKLKTQNWKLATGNCGGQGGPPYQKLEPGSWRGKGRTQGSPLRERGTGNGQLWRAGRPPHQLVGSAHPTFFLKKGLREKFGMVT